MPRLSYTEQIVEKFSRLSSHYQRLVLDRLTELHEESNDNLMLVPTKVLLDEKDKTISTLRITIGEQDSYIQELESTITSLKDEVNPELTRRDKKAIMKKLRSQQEFIDMETEKVRYQNKYNSLYWQYERLKKKYDELLRSQSAVKNPSEP